VVGVDYPAHSLAVWTMGDAELKRRAFFLHFQPLSEHEAGALKLEYFLVWKVGRPRAIDTLEDLVEVSYR
jgi:hypothetical protein